MTLSEIGPIVLIGAGKMGLALARGWLAGGVLPANLVLVDPHPSPATTGFAEQHGVRLLPSALGVLTQVMVLAVKPQLMHAVLSEVHPVVGRHTLVLSVAAGVTLKVMANGLGTERIVRAMPNTPAQIGKGVTGMVGFRISDEDREVAEGLLKATGDVLWFDAEPDLDAVTAISGSGPAYVFYLVETLAGAAVRQGLSSEVAMQLARQTVIGAGALLEADPTPASVLRENVTSPKGTTAAALSVLMGPAGLEPLMERAVQAARQRSEELGRS